MKGQLALFAGLMFAFAAGQASAQTIDNSPHDLGGVPGDNNEICVYCHTPHGAAADAPLWNKNLTTGGFTDYSSTTIDGAILAVGSVSIACLTCHDGTQATDAVINAPGTGAGLGFTNGTGTTTLGTLASQASFANLGKDLSNDHPIGIQYGSISGDADFVAPNDNGLASCGFPMITAQSALPAT